MALTYEPIATTTLSSAASSITFSSIPSTYTDLKVILVGKSDVAGKVLGIRFNSDTATNYSCTYLYGDGTTAATARTTSSTYITSNITTSATQFSFLSADIFSYAGSTYKTCLINTSEDYNGSGTTFEGVGLWRSTAAITSATLRTSSGNFATGTTATLYGIKNSA